MLLLPLVLFSSLSLAVADQSTREELIALAAGNDGVVKLDDDSFKRIVSPDRNWSSTIQLTALKSFKCPPCKELDPSFKAIAAAWSKVPEAHRDDHFFATLDFEDGRDTFRKLGLSSAPVLLVHPAAKGPRRPANGRADPLTYDFANSGFDAEALAQQMSRHTPVPIPYKAPPNYAAIVTTVSSVFSFLLVARFMLPFLMSRWVWAVITIGTSLVMVSGFMFVRIRNAPYVAGGPDGSRMILPGFQSQNGIEVQIIAFLYGVLSLGFISLIVFVPRQSSPTRQRYGVYIWLGALFTLFSLLISLFRIKNGGYPFKLLL